MLSTRHVVTSLVALVVSAGCVTAGFWQYGRYVTRADAMDRFDALATEPVADFAGLAAGDRAEWRRVALTGEFLPGTRTVLRNRRIDGDRTQQDLVWFQTDAGDAVLVLAGWAPADGPGLPSLPDGDGRVVVMLRAMEPDDGRGADTANRITPAQVPAPARAVTDVYGVVLPECADPTCLDVQDEPMPAPALSLGPHLAYSVQWWMFAVLAPFGAFTLIRRDREEAAAAKPRAPRRRRSGPTDEEIEDAL